MDEIAAVKEFRSQVPDRDAAAREAVRGALVAAMAATERRQRPRWHSRVALAAAAAGLVGVVAVSSAFGWAGRLVDLIAGEPAPPRIKQAFAVDNDARA